MLKAGGRGHQQVLNAQAAALAAGPSGQLVTNFGEVAPLALMSGSIELLQAWVISGWALRYFGRLTSPPPARPDPRSGNRNSTNSG